MNISHKLHIAIGTQVYLPHTQSWIYRQMKAPGEGLKLVLCNEMENTVDFPFHNIVVVSHRSLFWRKVAYKLHAIVKYWPYKVSSEKKNRYCTALIQNKINLVHIHFGVMGIELMDVCEELNIPLLVTFHGFDITAVVKRDPSYRKALLKLFSKLKFAISISSEMTNRLIQLGCPADKIRVSYLGIPIKNFPYVDRTKHSRTVHFLHAGRFSETKGVPDLINAFSLAFSLQDDAVLTVAGQGEQMTEVLEAIEASPIKNKIKLLGQQKSKEMYTLLSQADVFVLNCRTPKSGDKEGLPIALLEASSTGLPIISTFHAGVPEAVIHQQTGLLVNEYDQQALVQAMRSMLNKEVRIQYGIEARRLMEGKFDLEKCNQILSSIYHEAL